MSFFNALRGYANRALLLWDTPGAVGLVSVSFHHRRHTNGDYRKTGWHVPRENPH
jgi:hypothetical protein